MKYLVIASSFLLLSSPVAAIDTRPYSTCTTATNQLANRLSQDNIEAVDSSRNFIGSQSVKVILPERKHTQKYSPTNRQYGYAVNFVGKRSIDLIASPVLLSHLAEGWFDSCHDAATITFGIMGTSIMTTFGVNQDGSIKQWGCAEDLGFFPGRQGNSDDAPKWGYDFCSL